MDDVEAKPKAAKAKPAAAAKATPAAAKAKPESAKAKPESPKAKPESAKAKPESAKAKPAAAPAAAKAKAKGGDAGGTRESPWTLKTPSGQAEFIAFRDETLDPPALVVQVGKTELRYHLRCLTDLQAMLKASGDWVPLGSADEQKPAAEGTVEAWGRSATNPVGGWYGLKKGLRGRFGMYVPPVMKQLGLAEVENNPKNNRMRAL